MRRFLCILLTVFLLAALAVPCLAEDEIHVAYSFSDLISLIADGKKQITIAGDITVTGTLKFNQGTTLTFSNASLIVEDGGSFINSDKLLFDAGSSLVLKAGAKATNNGSGSMDFGRNGVLTGEATASLINKGTISINNDNLQFSGSVTQETGSAFLRMGYADSEASLRRLAGQKLSAVSLVTSVTLTEDLILPDGCILFLANMLNGRPYTLTLSPGVTLAIDSGAYLLLPGDSRLTADKAVLWNEGVIQSDTEGLFYGQLSLAGGTYKGRGTVQVLDDGTGADILWECLDGFDGYTETSLGLADDYYSFTLLQNGHGAVAPGDVNGDGSRSLADVSLLFRWWNGLEDFTAPLCIRDFNGDKTVDLRDASALFAALS